MRKKTSHNTQNFFREPLFWWLGFGSCESGKKYSHLTHSACLTPAVFSTTDAIGIVDSSPKDTTLLMRNRKAIWYLIHVANRTMLNRRLSTPSFLFSIINTRRLRWRLLLMCSKIIRKRNTGNKSIINLLFII